MKTEVIINLDIKGFHYYPEAPENVAFLRNNHRHIFNIKAGFSVTDLNREIEIFTMEGTLEDYITESYGSPAQFGEMSCEMIASELLEFLREDGCKWVEVLEDNKGGAKIYDS